MGESADSADRAICDTWYLAPILFAGNISPLTGEKGFDKLYCKTNFFPPIKECLIFFLFPLLLSFEL